MICLENVLKNLLSTLEELELHPKIFKNDNNVFVAFKNELGVNTLCWYYEALDKKSYTFSLELLENNERDGIKSIGFGAITYPFTSDSLRKSFYEIVTDFYFQAYYYKSPKVKIFNNDFDDYDKAFEEYCKSNGFHIFNF